ncbi:MAG: DEAD/DEAH box helicase family protein, partial [Propionibacteriaceae bacterium]|nr:DEAD/DEAH box helicase family protein [Propionibacteriaceae bacterium]
MADELVAGLYERLLTATLHDALPEGLALTGKIDADVEPAVLTRYLAGVIHEALLKQDPAQRLHLANDLLQHLHHTDHVLSPSHELLSVAEPEQPGRAALSLVRPTTRLSDPALLTNAPAEPSIGTELQKEIPSANRVDLLCAFVKWHGVRVLEEQLTDLRERGIPLRVVTTTYMGATERRALDRLVRDFGAEVRIQYDALRTRLHAKAWLFERDTGYSTAYVGSSNLSRAAMLDGLEWNVRLSQLATPTLLDKFRATFESYWNDQFFEPYDPDVDAERLDAALARAGMGQSPADLTLDLSGLDVRPYPYQQAILEALAVERDIHDRHRNLVVAATGTGKTVIAALDYRELARGVDGERPTLLFVAHRREILQQSLRTYREVLADANFGELHVDGQQPQKWRHVFASVQSLHAGGVASFDPAAFQIVVIDEFHHAEAATYRRILDHFAPHELLGLTATPERTDGVDVRQFFDGRTAAELRLWDALEAELLSPFHYFGLADGTDLSELKWSRGRYDEAGLSNLYTGNDARAQIVLKQLRDKVLNPAAMKALGFCVSVAHAHYMAAVFNKVGLPSAALSGSSSRVEREQILAQLRRGDITCVFTVDLFNEGVDLPDVDTLLMLRPTESATIFLQQLGRGLRRSPEKAVLTVLDFVGHHRKEFRWDHKLRALTGRLPGQLGDDVEHGFPFLPSGCQIVLDRETQKAVLANLRAQLQQANWSTLVSELRSLGETDLQGFLDASQRGLADVLKKGQRSWTELRRDAGLPTASGAGNESPLLKRIRAFAHVDDDVRVRGYGQVLSSPLPYAELDAASQRLARMLVFSIWPKLGFDGFDDALTTLREEAAVTSELGHVMDLAFDRSRTLPIELGGALALLPLRAHARYQREEILSALDHASPSNLPGNFREGVLYVPSLNVDALLVTLNKSGKDRSPTTMYKDYAISEDLFHWESQSQT